MLHDEANWCGRKLSQIESFPFSLCDAEKGWLHLHLTPITTWANLKRRVLEKFFLASKTIAIKKEISEIQ